MSEWISVTNVIIGVTVLLSIAGFNTPSIIDKLTFRPVEINKDREYYRFISSGFLHADVMHLLFNMIVLWSFGNFVESIFHYYYYNWGTTIYVLFYISAIVIASIPSYLKNRNNSLYMSLGASGAVSAVMFAAILVQPFGEIALYGIIRMPALVWGVLYLGYEYFASRRGGDNINHDAHLWGALYGIVFLIGIHPPIVIGFINKLSHIFSHG